MDPKLVLVFFRLLTFLKNKFENHQESGMQRLFVSYIPFKFVEV